MPFSFEMHFRNSKTAMTLKSGWNDFDQHTTNRQVSSETKEPTLNRKNTSVSDSNDENIEIYPLPSQRMVLISYMKLQK